PSMSAARTSRTCIAGAVRAGQGGAPTSNGRSGAARELTTVNRHGRRSMAGHKRTTIVLQERDLRLLEALQSMRVINREQAKVVAGFHSTRRANDRLLMLTRAGFLKRAFVGSREAVYWLPGKALDQKGRQGATPSHEPAALFLKHQLEINRVHLLVEYSGISIRGWWFAGWRSFQKPL